MFRAYAPSNDTALFLCCCYVSARHLATRVVRVWTIDSREHSASAAVTVTVVIALVLSRLDYCNSLLARLPVKLTFSCLQLAQNAAAHLHAGSDSSLRSRHWRAYQPTLATTARANPLQKLLPWTIAHSMAVHQFTCRRILHPRRWYPNRQSLTEAQVSSFLQQSNSLPSFSLTTVGKLAFPVSCANLCNELPPTITSALSLSVFKQRLKTFLFRRSYPDLLIWQWRYNWHFTDVVLENEIALLFRPLR